MSLWWSCAHCPRSTVSSSTRRRDDRSFHVGTGAGTLDVGRCIEGWSLVLTLVKARPLTPFLRRRVRTTGPPTPVPISVSNKITRGSETQCKPSSYRQGLLVSPLCSPLFHVDFVYSPWWSRHPTCKSLDCRSPCPFRRTGGWTRPGAPK